MTDNPWLTDALNDLTKYSIYSVEWQRACSACHYHWPDGHPIIWYNGNYYLKDPGYYKVVIVPEKDVLRFEKE